MLREERALRAPRRRETNHKRSRDNYALSKQVSAETAAPETFREKRKGHEPEEEAAKSTRSNKKFEISDPVHEKRGDQKANGLDMISEASFSSSRRVKQLAALHDETQQLESARQVLS